ncbi:MAG TPA: sigma-54 dependent transcriptional regulator [Nevskiaceae bacterium]|nr:sigma-54 dependent transcriptional regulator [Nevskiaceae bacterium]
MDTSIEHLLLGRSAAIEELARQLRKVAPTDLNVLITGESGAGKEAVAQAVHALSARHDRPFIPVNCGAIAPSLIEAELLGAEKGSYTGADRTRIGYFERAHGGTLLLDEVTEMPLDMQVKLLRVLESRSFQRVGGSELVEVDVRVLASTNRDVESAVREGRFREDLMYRLAVFPLRVPPLRDRAGDVEILALHFLDELNLREDTSKMFSRQCLQQLAAHPWPGNVRQLKNAVSRAFILADQIIDAPFTRAAPQHRRPARRDGHIDVVVGTPLADAQRELIEATLDHFDGDKRAAAQALGVSLKTLYNRLELYRGDGTSLATLREAS